MPFRLKYPLMPRGKQASFPGNAAIDIAYMGHRDARTGYWYLEATPALFTKIAKRCETFAGEASR
jgi:hypothetical protein